MCDEILRPGIGDPRRRAPGPGWYSVMSTRREPHRRDRDMVCSKSVAGGCLRRARSASRRSARGRRLRAMRSLIDAEHARRSAASSSSLRSRATRSASDSRSAAAHIGSGRIPGRPGRSRGSDALDVDDVVLLSRLISIRAVALYLRRHQQGHDRSRPAAPATIAPMISHFRRRTMREIVVSSEDGRALSGVAQVRQPAAIRVRRR